MWNAIYNSLEWKQCWKSVMSVVGIENDEAGISAQKNG
jgi:hypothetical protein